MNIKKILSILIALAMIFVSSATVVMAEEAEQATEEVVAIEAVAEDAE